MQTSIEEAEIQIEQLTGTNGTVPALLNWLGKQGSHLTDLTVQSIQSELDGNDRLTPLGRMVLHEIEQLIHLEDGSVEEIVQ